jgi:RNA polymerase sigma-70 factor (sigma-E family)
VIGKLSPGQLADFTEFAQGRQKHLMRTAYLLCGDRQTAQDLTQTALLNLCRAWARARRADSVDSYAHRVLINAFLSHQRKAARERKAHLDQAMEASVAEQAESPNPDLRLALLAALDQLPPKARAVVVLRFWEDLSVEATAAALGCSQGNVKSQSSRALARLRDLLGDGVFDYERAA